MVVRLHIDQFAAAEHALAEASQDAQRHNFAHPPGELSHITDVVISGAKNTDELWQPLADLVSSLDAFKAAVDFVSEVRSPLLTPIMTLTVGWV